MNNRNYTGDYMNAPFMYTNIDPVRFELQNRGYLCLQYGHTISMQDLRTGFTTGIELERYYFPRNMSNRLAHLALTDKLISDFNKEYTKSNEYVNPGPSNKQLENPSVKHAYEELQLIMKLAT